MAKAKQATGPQQIVIGIKTVLVEIPLTEAKPHGYVSQRPFKTHANAQLKGETAVILKRFTDGLRAKGETTANGKPVTFCTDAIRWLLERLVEGEE